MQAFIFYGSYIHNKRLSEVMIVTSFHVIPCFHVRQMIHVRISINDHFKKPYPASDMTTYTDAIASKNYPKNVNIYFSFTLT